MERTYVAEEKFENLDFNCPAQAPGEYDGCRFTNCNLAGADLGNWVFIHCEFTACDLSMAKLTQTALRDVKFKDCKMLGLHFEKCHDFGLALRFEDCLLDQSCFYQTKLAKTMFKNTRLREVDFIECDLSLSVFEHCDLAQARFEKTNLEKADFLTSFNYSLNPESNRVRKAKFSHLGLAGLLEKYDLDIKY
jgi:uncharacterized protein YjbI with pentapeptide repeats